MMFPSRRHHQARLVAVAVLTTALACGDSDSPTEPKPTTIAPTVDAYLDTALLVLETFYYYGDTVNWGTKRTRAYQRAGAAQTFKQVYPAIDTAVRELGDNHSFFYPPSQSLGRNDHPGTPFYTPSSTPIAPRIAYVWVPLFGGKSLTGRADTIQRAIARADSTPNLCGWILDLRGNPGGFWPVMLAGLSPLITPGNVGGFVERDTTQKYRYVVGPGVASLTLPNGQTMEALRVTTTYQLQHPGLPLAILQGNLTASAGEIILMAFKEPARQVRTFGAPSYGATTQPYTWTMSDSASIQVTAAMMFDRQGQKYGGNPIPVDQAVSGPAINSSFVPGSTDAVVNAAVAWLQTQPQCASSASALRLPAPDGGSWRPTRPEPGAIPANQWPRNRPVPWIAK